MILYIYLFQFRWFPSKLIDLLKAKQGVDRVVPFVGLLCFFLCLPFVVLESGGVKLLYLLSQVVWFMLLCIVSFFN